jgi:phage terminase large subunit-like protein
VSTSVPDFDTLTPEAQKAVAERLLRIEQSGWKPFWCPVPGCDGLPHRLLDEDGNILYAPVTATQGPDGEPLGEVEYEDPEATVRVPLGRPLLDRDWTHNHARADQRLPAWNKRWTLFIMSGRGSGKTRTGVEFVTLCARKGLTGAIVGRRGTELENTHVAEIIKHAHPEFIPEYKASKDILVWPNGAITYLFSAERPENIRSVNLSYCWFDEAAFMDEVETAWMNAKFATRVKSPGNPIHFLITSTPVGSPWVMKMEDDEDVEVRRVSTYANRHNLDPDFLADLEKEYEGTRMGRQELHGEVLRDVEGALWNDGLFIHERVTPVQFAKMVEAMDDRVVAVDPAGSKGKRSDATGIMGVGAMHFDENDQPLDASRFYVLADATLKGTPTEWARQVFKTALLIRATQIVAEKNFGGDMVKQVLTDFAKLHPAETAHWNGSGESMADMVKVIHAVQSKETRAEATVGKYEQGRVTHVTSTTAFGDLSELEKEQVNWVPKSRGGKFPSPNRIDALVWAVRQLEAKVRYVAQTATSKDIASKLRRKAS